jgi:hypothetical protein
MAAPNPIKKKAGGPRLSLLVLLISPVFILASLVLLPNFWYHIFMLLDYYYDGFVLFDSPIVQKYHSFLMSRMPDIPETPLPELALKDFTKENLKKMSNGYTFPVVIRGALKDLPAIKHWGNSSWWLNNYPDEPVLCKNVELPYAVGDVPGCTIGKSVGNTTKTLYVAGESKIFIRNPELEAMMHSDLLDSVAPGEKVFSQLFMGYPHSGSDVHSAMGCNMFRQISGRKKWWLIPISQTPYILGSINKNGFSAHSMTRVGKGKDEEPSPYLSKVLRYTVTLNPGDVLLNPAWFWHGIKNIEDPGVEIVVGAPTRYRMAYAIPGFRNNFILTAIGLRAISKRFGSLDMFFSSPANLQNGIEFARSTRAGEFASSKFAEDLKRKQEEIEAVEREL